MLNQLFLSLFFVLIFSITDVWATTFKTMPLDKLIDESNAAAEVELISKDVFMNKAGVIMTAFNFRVLESYNYDSNAGESGPLKLVMAGGSLNGLTSYIDGAPDFFVGERSFLLLKKYESKIYLSNFSMGKYKIEDGNDGVFYISTVFPNDTEIGRVKKEKMIELIKDKYSISKTVEKNESKVVSLVREEIKSKESISRRPASEEIKSHRTSYSFYIISFLIFSLSFFSMLFWWRAKGKRR